MRRSVLSKDHIDKYRGGQLLDSQKTFRLDIVLLRLSSIPQDLRPTMSWKEPLPTLQISLWRNAAGTLSIGSDLSKVLQPRLESLNGPPSNEQPTKEDNTSLTQCFKALQLFPSLPSQTERILPQNTRGTFTGSAEVDIEFKKSLPDLIPPISRNITVLTRRLRRDMERNAPSDPELQTMIQHNYYDGMLDQLNNFDQRLVRLIEYTQDELDSHFRLPVDPDFKDFSERLESETDLRKTASEILRAHMAFDNGLRFSKAMLDVVRDLSERVNFKFRSPNTFDNMVASELAKSAIQWDKYHTLTQSLLIKHSSQMEKLAHTINADVNSLKENTEFWISLTDQAPNNRLWKKSVRRITQDRSEDKSTMNMDAMQAFWDKEKARAKKKKKKNTGADDEDAQSAALASVQSAHSTNMESEAGLSILEMDPIEVEITSEVPSAGENTTRVGATSTSYVPSTLVKTLLRDYIKTQGRSEEEADKIAEEWKNWDTVHELLDPEWDELEAAEPTEPAPTSQPISRRPRTRSF